MPNGINKARTYHKAKSKIWIKPTVRDIMCKRPAKRTLAK